MNQSLAYSSFFPPSASSAPIELTYSAAQDLVSGETVKKGQLYIITDRANKGIYVLGLDSTHFEEEAVGGFFNADFQLISGPPVLGIWQAVNEGVIIGHNGDVVIWNNNHYAVVNKNAFNGTDPSVNTDAYELMSRSFLNFYILEYDKIIYDLTTDTILWRFDKRNNKINNVSLATWDWGNDESQDYRQEEYLAYVNGLNNAGDGHGRCMRGRQVGLNSTVTINNNRGHIFIDVSSSGGTINCPDNTGTLELHVTGFNSGAQGSNNSGDVKLYINDQSLVSFNNNSGDIYGRYADGANWNYDNNTEDWIDVDATNGSNGNIALPIAFNGIGGSQSKYLRSKSHDSWLDDIGNWPKNQFVFINNADGALQADLGIRIFCETKNQFALRASGGFLNPDYQNAGVNMTGDSRYGGVEGLTGVSPKLMTGIWQAANEGSYSLGDIVIWNGLHYQVRDTDGFDSTAPDIDLGSYTVLPKSAPNVGYIEEWDDIEYDFANNWIQSREDKRGNKVSATYNPDSSINPILFFQWGNNNVLGNIVLESLFNCINSISTRIWRNTIENFSTITANFTSDQQLKQCEFYSATADISAIAVGYTGKTLSPHLSTFDAVIDMAGLDTVPNPDYVGIISLINCDTTIINFSAAPTFEILCSRGASGSAPIFDNSSNQLKFPTPSTGTTLAIPLLDFIKFLKVGSKFIQTASEQY